MNPAVAEAYKHLKNILFLDIETVSSHEHFDMIDERMKPLWQRKTTHISNGTEPIEDVFFNRAAIYAEFGKIITIAVGAITLNGDEELCLRIKDITNDDEKVLLSEFVQLINEKFDPKTLCLCAHNGKEFDYPYICRRLLINGIKLPEVLDICAKKPWEVHHLDTLDMWKFGDKKSYTSLELLAALFGIRTSKDGIDGSKVNHVYYKERDLQRIAKYCKEDVSVLGQLYCKLKIFPEIKVQNISFV
jgi:3'-5' exonuclease